MSNKVWLFLGLVLFSPGLKAASSDISSASAKKVIRKSATTNSDAIVEKPHLPTASLPSEMAAGAGELQYSLKVNAALGGTWLNRDGLAILLNAQFGFPVGLGPSFFLGPEFDFMNFDQGSVLSVLLSAWRQFRFSSGSPWSFELGLVGGPAFPYEMTFLDNQATWQACLDLATLREIDDLSALRAVVRAGLINSQLLFSVRFGVQFRFL